MNAVARPAHASVDFVNQGLTNSTLAGNTRRLERAGLIGGEHLGGVAVGGMALAFVVGGGADARGVRPAGLALAAVSVSRLAVG